MGRTINDGLARLGTADVLLLQEVKTDATTLESLLHKNTDLELALVGEGLGLAIAVKPWLKLKGTYEEILQKRGIVGRSVARTFSTREMAKFRLRARGMIGVSLETPQERALTVLTTHPTVPVRFAARRLQVELIGSKVADIADPVVLAGDMNHWPGPRKVDLAMHETAGLSMVETDGPTYYVNQSRHAWLGRIGMGSLISGQLDAMLYRGDGLTPVQTELIDIPSDHRAISTTFSVQ